MMEMLARLIALLTMMGLTVLTGLLFAWAITSLWGLVF